MIRLENFTITDNRKREILKDVNIFIPSGSIVSIDGDQSKGKTSLLKAIGLVNKPNKGSVYLLGKNVKKLNRNEISDLRREIGIVYQENKFFEDFDLELNITYPLVLKRGNKKDIDLALRELIPWLSLEGLMKKSILELSNAELKLAQFARAIIGRPRILLLDNFFLDLEKNIQSKINYLIIALNKIGTSVLIFGPKPLGDTIKFYKKYSINSKNLIEIKNKKNEL